MDGEKYASRESVAKPHPIWTSNCISRLFFCYLMPFFAKGVQREFDDDQIYSMAISHQSYVLGDRLHKVWSKELAKKKDPSLSLALCKVFKGGLIFYGLLYWVFESIRIIQSLLISWLIANYEPDVENDKNATYLYAGLIVALGFLNVLIYHTYALRLMMTGIKMRTALGTLIYRKILKLSKSSLAQTTIGQMVNLMSNDMQRFDFVAAFFPCLWLAPLEVVIISWILFDEVGPTGLVGMVIAVTVIPLQLYMAKLTSRFRSKTAIRTDERVRLMNEIVSGIQVIKMYTWEKPFAKLVESCRKKELRIIRASSMIRALVASFNLVLNRLAIFSCILTYFLTGNVINATYAFTISSFYAALSSYLNINVPVALTLVAEARISIRRIKKFLVYEEIDLDSYFTPQGVDEMQEAGVNLRNVSVKWVSTLPECNLKNVDFEVKSRQLVALVGPVGGGKTTLLHTILKELPPHRGTVSVKGRLSYASQEPWVFGGTVKQNIIFGQEFEEQKYAKVVKACALERDFKIFPHGDGTLVGERGITLSGGQRARINLARAIYKDADIYLLDDPLSAVDTHVGKQLFDNCIRGCLANKCVVLVTHQLQYLKGVGQIYLFEGGRITCSGTYQMLKTSGGEFTKLLKESMKGEKKAKVEKRMSEDAEESMTMGICEYAPDREKEMRESGVISSHVYSNFFKQGGNYLTIGILVLSFIVSQLFGSLADYFVTIWVNEVQWTMQHSFNSNEIINNVSTVISEHSIGRAPWSQTFLDDAIYIYILLIAATVVTSLGRSIGFFAFCVGVSARLHSAMFNKIVFSPMRFFNVNPMGRILNRFSRDVGTLDETLPVVMIDTIQIGLLVLAATLVVGLVNPWLFIPTIIIGVIFYYLREVFLTSSRNLKRAEAIRSSLLYTHFTASLQGLTTIRAFRAEQILTEEFNRYQDHFTAAHFLFITATRTFGFWLDLNCVVYIAIVTVAVIFIQNESSGGNIGLALTQAMALTGMFQWGMRQWSELENQMTSVERVQEYADLEPEMDQNVEPSPTTWPENGSITFQNLSLRYSKDEAYVLKNLNFEIEPSEKIGIVGRTGAGKSSLIQALFRLAETEGKILIDGLNTKSVSFHDLRTKISIIPQEPVLFSGSFRKNLDPFEEHDDRTLWDALEEVELKQMADDLPDGLDSKMAEGGSNFSVGQRQLVCLARAIIRKNKVLVLDEATANVDPHTDALIQATIRRKFENCTVLTIAHRLNTIMDSDKVLVMDAGRVAEFGHPYVLLGKERGVFLRLVEKTGAVMAAHLKTIAVANYKSVRLDEPE